MLSIAQPFFRETKKLPTKTTQTLPYHGLLKFLFGIPSTSYSTQKHLTSALSSPSSSFKLGAVSSKDSAFGAHFTAGNSLRIVTWTWAACLWFEYQRLLPVEKPGLKVGKSRFSRVFGCPRSEKGPPKN